MSNPTKPGNLERGWNDPPVFLYNATSTDKPAAPARRHVLNKRVAFPSQPLPNSASGGTTAPPLVTDGQAAPASNAGTIQLLPPSGSADPPQFTAPLIVPSMDCTANLATNPVSGTTVASSVSSDPDLTIPDFESDEQMFHYVTSRLSRAVKDCQACSTEARVADEIQKKIEIFSEMWKNGKISYPVKCTMAKLATAVHRRKCSAAQELHLSLMIDHISEVSRWLIGIKRLIQEIETVAQPTSPSALCSGEGQSFDKMVENAAEPVKTPDYSVSMTEAPSYNVNSTQENLHAKLSSESDSISTSLLPSDHEFVSNSLINTEISPLSTGIKNSAGEINAGEINSAVQDGIDHTRISNEITLSDGGNSGANDRIQNNSHDSLLSSSNELNPTSLGLSNHEGLVDGTVLSKIESEKSNSESVSSPADSGLNDNLSGMHLVNAGEANAN